MRETKTIHDLKEEMKDFFENDNWRGAINYLCDGEHKPLLLWPRPTNASIDFIDNHLKRHKISKLVSLGCGTGLFEWIIKTAIRGLTVLGVEVDKDWWTSAYAPPVFHQLNYPDDHEVKEALSSESTALLFCYFNCEPAWRQYLTEFKGTIVFVCGPVEGSGTHSNPQPFQPLTPEWTLIDGMKMENSHDAVALYVKV
ncbi:uncharacterized protein LOC135942343 [Cloeon dipterum]|uniref:uncharacterized protein LOC135942343 n=1 Tax=Cloeon dipterum TaxID=197152 RepID=UPI00321F8382